MPSPIIIGDAGEAERLFGKEESSKAKSRDIQKTEESTKDRVNASVDRVESSISL